MGLAVYPSSRALAGRFQGRRLTEERPDAGGWLRAQVRKDGGGVDCRHSEPPGGGVKRSGAGLRAQSGAEPWLSHTASPHCFGPRWICTALLPGDS